MMNQLYLFVNRIFPAFWFDHNFVLYSHFRHTKSADKNRWFKGPLICWMTIFGIVWLHNYQNHRSISVLLGWLLSFWDSSFANWSECQIYLPVFWVKFSCASFSKYRRNGKVQMTQISGGSRGARDAPRPKMSSFSCSFRE